MLNRTFRKRDKTIAPVKIRTSDLRGRNLVPILPTLPRLPLFSILLLINKSTHFPPLCILFSYSKKFCIKNTLSYFEAYHSANSCSQSSFIPTKCQQYVKYIYLSPITVYMFRPLLHHLQGDHCVISSRTVCFLQCCYIDGAVKCKINVHFTFHSIQFLSK